MKHDLCPPRSVMFSLRVGYGLLCFGPLSVTVCGGGGVQVFYPKLQHSLSDRVSQKESGNDNSDEKTFRQLSLNQFSMENRIFRPFYSVVFNELFTKISKYPIFH